MLAIAAVTLLALLEYSIFGVLTGRARGKYGIKAPATSGNVEFEKYFRVHQNTLEAMIVFIPALWLFARFASVKIGVALGLVYLIARIIYARGYLADPEKRAPGAAITFGVNVLLVLGALIGIAIKLV